MTGEAPTRPERGSRRWRPLLRALVLALLAAGIFALGVAVGQATESNPKPGPAETRVRTIVPVPVTHATVTVTTTVTGEP